MNIGGRRLGVGISRLTDEGKAATFLRLNRLDRGERYRYHDVAERYNSSWIGCAETRGMFLVRSGLGNERLAVCR